MSDYVEGYVQPQNHVLIAQKAIVLNDKKQILFLKRSEKSGNGGRWDFCGGGLDKKENPIEGIKREIKEEAGLEVKNIKPIAVTSFDKENFVVMIGYQAEAISTNVTLSWEHDEYHWKTKEEAMALDLPEFFKVMLSSVSI